MNLLRYSVITCCHNSSAINIRRKRNYVGKFKAAVVMFTLRTKAVGIVYNLSFDMKFIAALLLYDFMWIVCKQECSVCGRVSEFLEYTA
jgi:hypothetical protein